MRSYSELRIDAKDCQAIHTKMDPGRPNEQTLIAFDEYEIFDDSIEFYRTKKSPVVPGMFQTERILLVYYKKILFDAIFVDNVK